MLGSCYYYFLFDLPISTFVVRCTTWIYIALRRAEQPGKADARQQVVKVLL